MEKTTVIDSLPRATMRLQLHKDFNFSHVRAQLGYFSRLGISHLYVSPILTARAGSMHGYDVVDHSTVNPELGGEEELRKLVAELRKAGMGLIVDIVPNHMAVGGNDNRLWLDVLEWGMHSRYADFFDIDWDVPDPALKNRLLAPFLGKPYGEALQSGEISLHFDKTAGRFAFHYYEHRFPLSPSTYAVLLNLGNGELAPLARHFVHGHNESIAKRATLFSENCLLLAEAAKQNHEVTKAIGALLLKVNGGAGKNGLEKNDWKLMHDILQKQNYRLASWRTAADEINWRRFFDVIQLAGVRIQSPIAFEIVHATTLRLYAEGLIDGIRVDHIDGLAYPRDYCRRLRTRLKRLTADRPADAAQGHAYFIVEKILAPGERFPRDWSVDGTTGYSFMNEAGALLHDVQGEAELANCWADISGRHDDFGNEMKRARRRVLRDLLPADFGACAYALHKIARNDIATRDWSLFSIRRTLAELLIHFPVYRTYANANGRSEADNEIMQKTVLNTLPECRPSDASLLLHIDTWLGREPPREMPSHQQRQMRLRAIARFQQLCAPLAAKAGEDTAFYRYSKLLSRNEVGADPTQFSLSVEDFHSELSYRAAHFPRAMLATATHDHKRGEDLRARLAVLSEMPVLWRKHVKQWRELNARYKVTPLSSASEWPEPADEYMLYQMLAGSWPPALRPFDQPAMQEWRDRLAQWYLKALREAKSITSWTEPNIAYESACKYFLFQLLDLDVSAEFIGSLHRFAEKIAPAGAINGLSQLLLKLTAPGVPDIYQGCEWWDFSFADPDNRRPVNFEERNDALNRNEEELPALLERWRDGQVKQKLLQKLLHIRKQMPDLFTHGNYRPMPLRGEHAQHGFAFSRSLHEKTLLVFVPRLTASLLKTGEAPTIAADTWGDTHIALLERFASRQWRCLLAQTDNAISSSNKNLFLRDALGELPFTVLYSAEAR